MKKVNRLTALLIALVMLLSLCGAAEPVEPEASPAPSEETVEEVSTETEDEPTEEDSSETEEESTEEDSTETEDEPTEEDSTEAEEESTEEDSTETEDEPTEEDSTEAEEEPTEEDTTETEEESTEEDSTETEEESTEEDSTDDEAEDTEVTPLSGEAGLDGTTEPVDDATALADGEYLPEDFTFSGGSGKTTITCTKVTVTGGHASATIAFSSASWSYVKASGSRFDATVVDGKSVFEIPVDLNADNAIIGMTTAMSTAKEVAYTIRITLDETAAPQPGEDAPVEDGDYNIAIGSDFKMFTVTGSSAKAEGGKVTATISTASATYDRIYLGSKDDEDKSAYVAGVANAAGGYDFTFELPAAYMGQSVDFVPGKPDGSWYVKNQYHLTIPEAMEKVEEPAEEPTEAPVEDGDYNVDVESSSSMFKVVASVLTAKDGAYTAVITLSGTGYDKLFVGTAEEAVAADDSATIPFVENADGQYTYTIPVAKLDAPIAIAAHSLSKDQWYDRTLTFKSEGMEKNEAPVEDGDYNVDVESSSSMFKVVASVLTAKDGAYTAVITLSGTGYDKLFVGTAEEAVAADDSATIPFVENADGQYTYTIPVAKLDAPIAIAAHSLSKDQWYDRTLTFKSEGMEKLGGAEEPAPEPTPELTPAPTPAPEADLSGSTGKVNSATTLADGTYAPDKFSFSGGTGKTTISCPKVTVSGGKATATIVFSSPNYAYVKANGSKYYPSVGGGTSTFSIPVKLNSNNTIIGMTTAMSQDHEITYTIYIYIEAADGAQSSAPGAEAAKVAGLSFTAADEITDAELFQIYRYEGGFAVIDVKDAGRWLLIPEGAEAPAGLEEDAALVQLPVQRAYAASDAALALIERIGSDELLDKIAAVGSEAALPERMAAGEVAFAGSAEAPDYAALLVNGCDFAILPETFSVTEDDARTPEELAQIGAVAERLEMLGIPGFVDRSAMEPTERGRLEWIKVYGLIFGCEDAALEAYAQAVAALDEAA